MPGLTLRFETQIIGALLRRKPAPSARMNPLGASSNWNVTPGTAFAASCTDSFAGPQTVA